jgi:hypothetical protein
MEFFLVVEGMTLQFDHAYTVPGTVPYVDGWVMWPPGVFPLLTGVLGVVAAT